MRLLTTTALLLTITLPAHAAIIDVGVNPTSAQGHFSNDVGGGFFSDQITFALAGAPAFVTFASATNDYTQSSDFITAFTGQLFNAGADLVPGGVDDFAVNPLVNAVPCTQNPTGCQILAGSALLDPGSYYLNLEGTGGGTSGYGGNLTTLGVPGPLAGAGLPGILAALGGLLAWRKRRRTW
jgi:hypothetical protein